MNLSRFGAATVIAAIALVGSLGISACGTPQESAITTQPHDKLEDWVTTTKQPGITGAWRLGVDKLFDVKPELQAEFFGVGTLGNNCIVTFSNLDSERQREAQVLSRYDDSLVEASDPLPQAEILYWTLGYFYQCQKQTA